VDAPGNAVTVIIPNSGVTAITPISPGILLRISLKAEKVIWTVL